LWHTTQASAPRGLTPWCSVDSGPSGSRKTLSPWHWKQDVFVTTKLLAPPRWTTTVAASGALPVSTPSMNVVPAAKSGSRTFGPKPAMVAS